MKKSKTWVLLLIGTFIVSYIATAAVSAQTEITAYSTTILLFLGFLLSREYIKKREVKLPKKALKNEVQTNEAKGVMWE